MPAGGRAGAAPGAARTLNALCRRSAVRHTAWLHETAPPLCHPLLGSRSGTAAACKPGSGARRGEAALARAMRRPMVARRDRCGMLRLLPPLAVFNAKAEIQRWVPASHEHEIRKREMLGATGMALGWSPSKLHPCAGASGAAALSPPLGARPFIICGSSHSHSMPPSLLQPVDGTRAALSSPAPAAPCPNPQTSCCCPAAGAGRADLGVWPQEQGMLLRWHERAAACRLAQTGQASLRRHPVTPHMPVPMPPQAACSSLI